MKYKGVTPVKKITPPVWEAEAIIRKGLQTLKRRYSCFLYAFNIFEPVAVQEKIEPATDGRHLFFHAEQVNGMYKENGTRWLYCSILHMLFHGMFGHFEVEETKEWVTLRNSVMDLKVEQMLHLLGFGELWYWEGNEKIYSPGLYQEGRRNKKRAKEIIEDSVAAKVDEHRYWLKVKEHPENTEEDAEEDRSGEETIMLWMQARKQVSSAGKGKEGEELSVEKLLGYMEGKHCGMTPGAKRWLERAALGNGSDYCDILKQLITQREVVKEEDTIDPMLYLYGLECYGDVALVEPLELSDKKKMNTLVIAVDTSGSCIDAVPVFLRETAAILRDAGRIASGGELCYLECDAQITAECMFQDYSAAVSEFASREVEGGGGTDFRPVFSRIEELVSEGKKIDGLFYLSDGDGCFPDKAPDYPVYFVMDKEMNREFPVEVPDWVTIVWL